MEEASKLRESATDVAEAMCEIEGYMQRIKDIAVEVIFLLKLYLRVGLQ